MFLYMEKHENPVSRSNRHSKVESGKVVQMSEIMGNNDYVPAPQPPQQPIPDDIMREHQMRKSQINSFDQLDKLEVQKRESSQRRLLSPSGRNNYNNNIIMFHNEDSPVIRSNPPPKEDELPQEHNKLDSKDSLNDFNIQK